MNPMHQMMMAEALRRQQLAEFEQLLNQQIQPDPQGQAAPMNPDMLELQYLAQQSPEQLQAQFQPFDDQQAILDKQLMMSQQMRQPQSGEHSTAIGAALGGLGDVVNSGIGAATGMGALGGMEALAGKKQKDAASRVGDYAKFATAFGF